MWKRSHRWIQEGFTNGLSTNLWRIGLSIYIWQNGFPNNGFSTDICHRDWWCGGVQAPRKKSIIVICKTFCDIFRQCAFEYCYCLVIFFTTIYFGTFRFVSFTLCYGTYRWDFNNQYAFDTKNSYWRWWCACFTANMYFPIKFKALICTHSRVSNFLNKSDKTFGLNSNVELCAKIYMNLKHYNSKKIRTSLWNPFINDPLCFNILRLYDSSKSVQTY